MPITYDLNLPFLIATAIYIGGRAFDAYSSLNGQYYGVSEANPLWRDKDRNFVMWKYIAGSVVIWLACFGLLWADATIGWAMLALWGGMTYIVAYLNRRKKQANRKAQIKALQLYRDTGTITFGMAITQNGKTYMPGFRWIYSENPDIAAAVWEVQQRLYELCLRPESEWFPA